MRKVVSNLSYSFVANLVTMLVSVLIVLLIPKFWGELAYGYFQLYLFYISYVGFFHLGWIDGIYLRIGGQKYDKLNQSVYAAQFRLLFCIVVLVALTIGLFSAQLIQDGDKLFVVLMTCICLALYLPITYINYIFQSTNRIQEYAKIILSEKIVFVAVIIGILVSGRMEYRWLIYADLAGKLVSFVISLYYARDLVFAKAAGAVTAVREMLLNISIGCKLMIANVASMLIIGIVRFAIEGKWGVATFGKVSLALSVSNLFITFVTAVSVVIFPLLKQMDDNKKIDIYNLIRHLLMPCLMLLLCFYYPAQLILGYLLPAYQESLLYLGIMMPVCIFECKMAVLINTYLKVLRKEKQILFVNVFVVVLSFLMTLLTVHYLESLEAAIVGIVLLIAVRTYFAEFLLTRDLGISISKETVFELLLTVVFICASWWIGGVGSMAIYTICYFIYFFYMKDKFMASMKMIKKRG